MKQTINKIGNIVMDCTDADGDGFTVEFFGGSGGIEISADSPTGCIVLDSEAAIRLAIAIINHGNGVKWLPVTRSDSRPNNSYKDGGYTNEQPEPGGVLVEPSWELPVRRFDGIPMIDFGNWSESAKVMASGGYQPGVIIGEVLPPPKKP